jgi:hypothetical protein
VQQGGFRYVCDTESCTPIDMGASTGSQAYVTQSGQFQNATVYQGGTAQAYVTQGGMWDELTLIQQGAGNYANTYQFGTGSDYTQRNVASITQMGNGLTAYLTQVGMGNNATINQH